MAVSLRTTHRISTTGLVAMEEASGVALRLVAYLATCWAHLHLASAIISRMLNLVVVGARLGLDPRGGHQGWVAALVQAAVGVTAPAQGLLLVSELCAICLIGL